MHIVDWNLRLALTEDEERTTARVTLQTRDRTLTGRGVAVRDPRDPDVPEIGDELAAGRALIALGRQLLAAGAWDVDGVHDYSAGDRRT